jgi:hypothetical protein
MDGAAAERPAAGDLPEVLTAIDRERREIRERRNREIREVEGKFDGLLDKLDRAVAALADGGARKVREEDASQPHPPKKTRRRRVAVSTTPAAAKERREAVFRYLIEAGRKVAPREIQRDLNLTPSCVQSALAQLRKDGRVIRFGAGNGTRYEVKPGSRSDSQASPVGDRATLEGLILETVEARGYASLDELVQATGYLREDVRDACGALQIQDELRMEQRNGRPVHVRHQLI